MAARLPEIDARQHDGTATVDDNVTFARDVSLLSDLRNVVPDVLIVAMSSLPCTMGTLMHPLLRAVYLVKAVHAVSLVVQWMELPEDWRILYPNGTLFASRYEQARVLES